MLNAVNLGLVAFSRYNNTMDGNLFVFLHHRGSRRGGCRVGHRGRSLPQTPDRSGQRANFKSLVT